MPVTNPGAEVIQPEGKPTADLPAAEMIITVEHLTKIFPGRKTVTAVDDVSIAVKKGEIFGLLGPNGAGKSTLIRILTTLLKPTSGEAQVGPYHISREPEKVREIIGVCPQNSTLDVELTAYDNLEFYGKLLNVDDRVLAKRIGELLEAAGLADRAHAPVQTFSGGMRRKLEIVRAFLHRPLILFLDEPTIGLDPDSRRDVWRQISRLNAENTTIILTTHYMDEAEHLCHRIAFMDRGKLVSLDTSENLKHLLPAGDLIEIGFEQIDAAVPARIRELSHVQSADIRDHTLRVTAVNGSRVLPAIVAIFERYGNIMTSISIRSPSLEDVFIFLTGKKLDGADTDHRNGPEGRRT
ncbi:MAG: ATP-binding cassette domain-containing protein [Methanomicrobiales archaeon]|nr:ATP-binding cassette domain-containing protein [Methanomicrobiales archaeon]